MKRAKLESFVRQIRVTLIQTLMAALFLYFLFMGMEMPLVFRTGNGYRSVLSDALPRPLGFDVVGTDSTSQSYIDRAPERKMLEEIVMSTLFFNETVFDTVGSTDEFTMLPKAAKKAWLAGQKLWEEMESGKMEIELRENGTDRRTENCPDSIALSGWEFSERNRILELPCGLTLGSHVTVVGEPKWAHPENDPKISLLKEGEVAVMVSQFLMELQGLKVVDGEDPPKILHFNPRLKGDWSGKPVIEQNTCYRMQWGSPLRCEGWSSRADEETVDGQVKCEKWLREDDNSTEESKVVWWLNKLIAQRKKISYLWPFPFAEGKLFVLTVSAGLEGYHINVGGRHITSFPYRPGFVLEDATGLYLNGDINVNSVFAASLPSSHPTFASQQHLEMFPQWQAPPLLGKVELFIGILSAASHFAERMTIRKTWMQHNLIRSSSVVACFFVALNGRKEINSELNKEAKYFGDIVVVPYLDHYDLVVLKTLAICEYGIRKLAANYIMKCDDDTFVRVDAVIKETRKVGGRSLFLGNMNYYHRPLRSGKWAVTFEEWPEEEYPPYADGPGYILSSDIAWSILKEFESHKLRLFKMEDVSMGMWVEKFNSSKPVDYVHSLKFCQYGCIDDYYTAHYQSPRQMVCLWDKLQQGRPHCCNMR
ncbi:hypothetical protein K2173_006359 [Erythroxylum novogranatense]|uniref:Galectin domain-containing protein n=1 Tax=Erythroxylum novogranatense TaxID=1862640 RepID=A0AAV8U6A6_9ROSI|nr:hypothetical protein K2173_006359 [Erythroxylum novogranatense]